MLTDRQRIILKFIVDDFISTGHPVGSRTLSKYPQLNVSAATIRNEMADLEEFGFITQPHISAGRVPSQLGLRFYVDSFLEEKGLISSDFQTIISRLFSERHARSELLLNRAAKLLSEQTGMAAVITAPAFSRRRLANLRLVLMNEQNVLLVLVSDQQDVETAAFGASQVTQASLDELSDGLVRIFGGETIEGMSHTKVFQLKREYPQHGQIVDVLIPVLRDLLRRFDREHVSVWGTDKLLAQGPFADLKSAGKVMHFFEEPQAISKLLDDGEEGTRIRIGDELGNVLFNRCSIIQSDYDYGSGQKGTLAVVGSIRMNYAGVRAIVEIFRDTLTDIFSGIQL